MVENAKTTVLEPVHEQLGAQFTDFSGWKMPLKYGSELEEHRAVRNAAGLFDLSHMGQINLVGDDASTLLNIALVGNFHPVPVGKAKYSLMLNDDGGIIDDLIVYHLDDERFMVIPNAGNADAVLAQLEKLSEGLDVKVVNRTPALSLLGLQGPASMQILQALPDYTFAAVADHLKNYTAAVIEWHGEESLLARTGYTGEDGFEIIVQNQFVKELWDGLLEAGKDLGLIPCGLAARDSLRLEAGMPLYGNELSQQVNPYEAGLNGAISFKKEEDFVGKKAIETIRDNGPQRTLVALTSEQRRAGRAGDPILIDGEKVGTITSGIPSPTLGHPVAMGYVETAKLPAADQRVGIPVQVEVRGKPLDFTITKAPFYRAKK